MFKIILSLRFRVLDNISATIYLILQRRLSTAYTSHSKTKQMPIQFSYKTYSCDNITPIIPQIFALPKTHEQLETPFELNKRN